MEISLSLPCYNEEKNVESVVGEAISVLSRLTDKYEIIIVNDGSVDDTKVVAERLSQQNPNIIVINHELNRGYGAAVSSGLKNSRYDYVCFVDGDGQFNLEEIEKLIELIPENDMVIGYRVKRSDPFYRLLNAKLYGILIRLLFNLRVRDINCAFKMVKKKVINDLKIESAGALVNAEILIKAKKRGYNKIKEIPVSHYPRKLGKQTGANPWVIIKTFKEIFKLRGRLK